jgi:hypothetical protein
VDGAEHGSFEQQEARILVAEGVDACKPVRLVVNFFSRPEIRPFVFDWETQEFLTLWHHEYGNNSLARVFETVIRSCLENNHADSPYGAEIIREIHVACFAIRERALLTGISYDQDSVIHELCSQGTTH